LANWKYIGTARVYYPPFGSQTTPRSHSQPNSGAPARQRAARRRPRRTLATVRCRPAHTGVSRLPRPRRRRHPLGARSLEGQPREEGRALGLTDGRARGASRRSGAAGRRARPTVDALGPAPAALPTRLRPPALPHGAARLRARAPERASPPGAAPGAPERRDRHG